MKSAACTHFNAACLCNKALWLCLVTRLGKGEDGEGWKERGEWDPDTFVKVWNSKDHSPTRVLLKDSCLCSRCVQLNVSVNVNTARVEAVDARFETRAGNAHSSIETIHHSQDIDVCSWAVRIQRSVEVNAVRVGWDDIADRGQQYDGIGIGLYADHDTCPRRQINTRVDDSWTNCWYHVIYWNCFVQKQMFDEPLTVNVLSVFRSRNMNETKSEKPIWTSCFRSFGSFILASWLLLLLDSVLIGLIICVIKLYVYYFANFRNNLCLQFSLQSLADISYLICFLQQSCNIVDHNKHSINILN